MYNAPRNNNKPNLLNGEISKTKSRLDKVKKLKQDLYEDYKNEIITKSDYLEFKDNYTLEESQLNSKIESMENEKNNIESIKTQTLAWEDLYNRYVNCTELNQEIVNEFIELIEVFEDENNIISVGIKYKEKIPSFLY
jgi:vacuolar-type H+-ATPase subunit I/STV1